MCSIELVKRSRCVGLITVSRRRETMDKRKLMDDVFGGHYGDCGTSFVDDALSMLEERERDVLILRYSGLTYKEVANRTCQVYGEDYITRQRARQIVEKSKRKLRHPYRSRVMRGEISLNEAKTKFQAKFKPDEPIVSAEWAESTIPIGHIDFSERVRNCMKNGRIETIGDLASKTYKELLSIRHFGRKSLYEVKCVFIDMI